MADNESVPETMRHVALPSFGAPEVMELASGPVPTVADGEVLVRVVATAVNRADTLQRKGVYNPPAGASPILGLEGAGVVASVGAGSDFAPGDRVCFLLAGGGYAEYVNVREDALMRVPEGVSLESAGAFPETFLTAWQSLSWIARFQPGETVLIHAGASGVGTSAIQIATQVLGAARVIVTASTQAKLDRCLALGATHGISYKETPQWSEEVLALTDGRGVDVIMDFVGQAYWEQNLASLAPDGRMVMQGLMSGADAPAFSLRPFLRKRISVHGSTLRARSDAYKAKLTADMSAAVMPLLATGDISVVVAEVFDLGDVVSAHQMMENNANVGKIVLRVAPP